jgi:hypothetical protein
VQSECNFSLISRFCIISIFQNQLEEFKREYGHCNVPRSYERNPQLGIWCNNHRPLFKNGKLSQDRIDKLNELGFEWNIQKRKREDICEQPPVDGNEENAHPNNNIIVENNLANEEQIVKKSKKRHNKIDLRERKMNEKCERGTKQIVDIAGEKASKLLEGSITECRLKLLLGERFSELEKLPSHPNLYRLRVPIEWEVDLLDCERVKQADLELENIFEEWQTRIDNDEE